MYIGLMRWIRNSILFKLYRNESYAQMHISAAKGRFSNREWFSRLFSRVWWYQCPPYPRPGKWASYMTSQIERLPREPAGRGRMNWNKRHSPRLHESAVSLHGVPTSGLETGTDRTTDRQPTEPQICETMRNLFHPGRKQSVKKGEIGDSDLLFYEQHLNDFIQFTGSVT